MSELYQIKGFMPEFGADAGILEEGIIRSNVLKVGGRIHEYSIKNGIRVSFIVDLTEDQTATLKKLGYNLEIPEGGSGTMD